MAFKLSKAESKQRDDLVALLKIAEAEVSKYIAAANAQIAPIYERINSTLITYNDILEDVREFTESVTSRLEDEFGEKSEKWQDSDKGQAAQALSEDWAAIDLEDIEPFQIDPLEDPDPGHRDALENLSSGSSE